MVFGYLLGAHRPPFQFSARIVSAVADIGTIDAIGDRGTACAGEERKALGRIAYVPSS